MNHRLDLMKPSASLVLMTKAREMRKKDPTVIGLAGGEPDFATPDRISMAAIRSLTEGNTHYVVGPGIPELRSAIANKLRTENGILCDENCILVTPGGKNAIYLAVHAVLNEGDEAVILNPAWVSYEPIVIAAGGVPVFVDLDYRTDYRITAEALENAVTEKTRLLIINYPNNPTGRVLHEDEADILEAFLLKHPEIYLLSDEVYERIVFDGNRSVSMASRPAVADRVITMNGFSKSVAMTGWRMGYLVSNKEVFQAAYKLYQHSLSCMSGFMQVGAVEAFKCQREIEDMRRIYEQRRDMFTGILNSIPGVSCPKPEGAFYAWVYYDVKGMNSNEMCEYLLENARVVGMPGTAYGETRVACMRFSFANATEELEDAANRIKEAILKLY
ncbi:MAG: pyridoxal phosphate-dependent aminotransferase [Oscillospiraceae bacterium]|nr:pyridoxal phosphate-dependent aminotransferase [Oscillospiraceae bacterium]MBR2807600.1 pyridoxal phosphate-dependent aminotransferase [Oscillospiraceae bacterium]